MLFLLLLLLLLLRLFRQNRFPHQFLSNKHRRENNLDQTWKMALPEIEISSVAAQGFCKDQ